MLPLQLLQPLPVLQIADNRLGGRYMRPELARRRPRLLGWGALKDGT